jgi:hypothetical protein
MLAAIIPTLKAKNHRMETGSTIPVSKSRRLGLGGGAPPGNRNAVKHGLHSYKAMLNGNGLDERTSLFKALREKAQELVKALGGDPSPQEQAIIGDSVKDMLYIASLDNYLMGLKSLVRKGRPHPVLAIRTTLSAHLRENLKTLGLKRVAKTLSLHEILTKDDDQQGTGTADEQP